MHLTSNGCVAIWFAMLTYEMYAPLTNKIDALPLNIIYYFGDSFCLFKKMWSKWFQAENNVWTSFNCGDRQTAITRSFS